MKNKFFATALFAFAFSANSFSQSTDVAGTSGELVAPISVTKITDMNFGTFASSITAGSIILDYVDGRTATNGFTLLSGGTQATTAEFSVTGEGNSGFSISIPASPITLTGSVAGTMTVSGFFADLGASGFLVSGIKAVKVKATLNVPINSVPGTYSNASDLFVTVNYN